MLAKLKEKYFDIRWKLHDWWNPYIYYRLPLSDHEKDFSLRMDLQLSVGEVFNGYKIQDVTNTIIRYIDIDPDSAGDPSDVIESQEVNRIEVTLNELYSRQVIKPDTLKDANSMIIDFIKGNAIESFRNEIDKKGWTNLLIRDGIRTDVFKEIWVRWKRWHQWINWIFRRIVISYDEEEKYVVYYGVRIGGYNEKVQAAKK